MSSIFLFSDIDDTLIQTKRKTDFSKNTVVGAYNREGLEHSFFYEGTKKFVDTVIKAGITFIPTTARSIDSYKRTTFYQNPKIKRAILNFGGVILERGEVDREWESITLNNYSKIIAIDELYSSLVEKFEKEDFEIVIKVIDNFYISLYNKYNLDRVGVLERVREVLSKFIDSDFYIYENDNSFGVLPKFLNKKFAVEYLIDRESPILTIGAGDNISDLDFMDLTSFHLIPNNSNIYEKFYKKR